MIDKIKKLLNWFKGKKTYIVCAATISVAVLEFYLKQIGLVTMVTEIFAALGLAGLRNGITSSLETIVIAYLQSKETTPDVVENNINNQQNNQ